jgi:hypothetical protein
MTDPRSKAKNERMDEPRRQGDGACHKVKSNDEAAKVAMARTRDLDGDESCTRVAKIQDLVATARIEVDARHFTAAIELLTEAGRIDPANSELASLLDMARSGQEQEGRRRAIERLQSEVVIAISSDEVKCAMVLVNEALEKMHNEPTLLQLKRQLEQQEEENERSRLVSETVQKCRALMEQSPPQALELARGMLCRFPGEERLHVLRSSIEQHLQRVNSEGARVRYLALANQALDQRRYREAVHLLEACRAQGAFSDEMTGLLDFARHEAHREQRQALIESTSTQAQAFLAKAAHEEAVQLLEPVVAQTADPGLRILLEKARAQQQFLKQKANAISEALAVYLREEQFDEGIAFLQSQPEATLQRTSTQDALNALRVARDRDRRALSTIAMAYSALDQQGIAMRWNAFREGVPTRGESPFLQQVARAFDARRKAAADQALATANEQAQASLTGGDARAALRILDGAAALAEFGRPELQTERQRLREQASRSSILRRIGLSGPRERDPKDNPKGL